MRAIVKSPTRCARRPLSLKGANGASNNIHYYPITTEHFSPLIKGGQGGFTLVEIIVSIVAFGILMTLIIGVFAPQVVGGTDPLFSMRAAELGQSYLEEILGKRFDENSPSGNTKRCGEGTPLVACTGAFGVDAGETAGSQKTFNDVDDYITLNNSVVRDQNDAPRAGYDQFRVSVTVTYAGTEAGLPSNDNAKRIDVTIIDPRGNQYLFSAYKANF